MTGRGAGGPQEVLDGAGPPVHNPHDFACLALEVEVKVQVHCLHKNVEGDSLVCALSHWNPEPRAQVADHSDRPATATALQRKASRAQSKECGRTMEYSTRGGERMGGDRKESKRGRRNGNI